MYKIILNIPDSYVKYNINGKQNERFITMIGKWFPKKGGFLNETVIK